MEYVIRGATLVLYFLLSFGFATYLPKRFCHLFNGVFSSKRTQDEMVTCVWQVFGFRMVFMLLYLPIEMILFAVVYRHSKDLKFMLGLKRYLKKGYEDEFLKL